MSTTAALGFGSRWPLSYHVFDLNYPPWSVVVSSATYYWQVRAVNAAGVTYADNSGSAYWSFTTSKPQTSLTFKSVGAYDGWVLESSELSNKGGSLNAAATTFILGDDKTKKQYRDILSFNTASLPDKAVITSVTLKLRKSAVVGGGDPVSIFNGFMVDIKKGFFGTAALLQVGDFQAAASKTYGPFKPAPVSSWYSIDLTNAKDYINKLTTNSGLTQIRVRFKLDDNNNAVANYLTLFSGNAPAASNRPQLIITYYVP